MTLRWNVGTKIGAGFGLTLVIFLFVGGASYRSTTQLIEASNARRHTYDVLKQLAEVLMLLTTAQTSQRGYVITGDDAYLEPYQDALGRLDQTVRDLRSLTADSAAQQRRLATLEPLIQSRLALAREATAVRRANGRDAAAQATKASKGEANMDEIRDLLGDMQGDEDALLETRVALAQADASNAKWTILLGTLAAWVVAMVAGFATTRNIAGPLRQCDRSGAGRHADRRLEPAATGGATARGRHRVPRCSQPEGRGPGRGFHRDRVDLPVAGRRVSLVAAPGHSRPRGTGPDHDALNAIASALGVLDASGETPATGRFPDQPGPAAPAPESWAVAPSEPSTEPAAVPSHDTVRISVAKLDARLVEAEEMLTAKLTTAQRAVDLRELAGRFEAWRRESAALEPHTRALRLRRSKSTSAFSKT